MPRTYREALDHLRSDLGLKPSTNPARAIQAAIREQAGGEAILAASGELHEEIVRLSAKKEEKGGAAIYHLQRAFERVREARHELEKLIYHLYEFPAGE